MQTIRYKKLVGTYYLTTLPSKWLIIVAIWAPNIEDIENLRNREILNNGGYDIFVPEYYWFCRSGGFFSPYSSLATLIDSYSIFTYGYKVRDIHSRKSFSKKYNTIHFLWLSYGWSIVMLLPRFLSGIKSIGAFYPVLEYNWLWSRYDEETAIDFLRMLRGPYRNLYRLSDTAIWKRHFSHKTDIIPSSYRNMKYLSSTHIFLAHGKNDTSISYRRTEKYAKKLSRVSIKKNLCILYEGLDHGYDTLVPASYDFISWLDAL